MKKFKLVRMAALGVAATITVNLTACSIKDNHNNDSSTSINNEEVTSIDYISKAIDYKYNTLLAEDSLYKCGLSKVADDTGVLVGSCYSLPNNYYLYTPQLDNQGYAVPSITLEDGTQIFALSEDDALSCVGVTEEAYQMLAVIDEYERQLDTTDKMSR